MALVGAFALLHGQAHGGEMAAGAAVLGFCLGLALATALLQGGGLGLAATLQCVKPAAAVSMLAGLALGLWGLAAGLFRARVSLCP